MATISLTQFFKAPPEQVFKALGTHAALGKMARPLQVKRIRDSADPHHVDGLGSVRLISLLPALPSQFGLQERITAYEPNSLIEYEVVDSPLVRHHRGTMRFTEQADGTRLDYDIEMDLKLPVAGEIASQLALQGLKAGLSRGLAAAARELEQA